MSAAALLPLVLKISLALLVFALGLAATLQDVTYLFRRPRELLRAILAIFVVMPLVAVLLAKWFVFEPAVRIGLIALALSPLPPVFPRKALKQGGRVSFTCGLLVSATLLSVLVIPLGLEIIQATFGIPLQMRSGSVLVLGFWGLLLPLGVGLLIHRLAPGFAARAAGPISTVAFVVLMLCVIPILIRVWPAMVSLIGNGTILVMVVFVLVGLAVGHFLGGPDREDRTVLALSTATRHPAIAIAIAQANFPDQKLAPAAILLYVLVSVIAAAPYLRARRRREVGTQGRGDAGKYAPAI
jgi:bile acid:Na+ symporter, BASS family